MFSPGDPYTRRLRVNRQKGLVFVAPALLPVMKEGLVFVASATPAGDLDKGLLWLNAEC